MRWLIERIVSRSRSRCRIVPAALVALAAEQDRVAARMRIAAHVDPGAEHLRDSPVNATGSPLSFDAV